MLGAIGALAISLIRQRAGVTAKAQAHEPLPAKLVVRPISETRERLVVAIGGYGGQADDEPDEIIARFADDAAGRP